MATLYGILFLNVSQKKNCSKKILLIKQVNTIFFKYFH
ncbi:hypothetical protein J504_2995 [Acinetobacter baumannii 348935]|nr:hypothetical protein J504_2995 [Acinetobacter baumannii 348935]